MIHLESVECSYPGSDLPAISDFSLLVQPGEFVSILGRSGAGKTTALRVIAGFEQVTDGYVRIGGQLVGSSFVHIPSDHRRVWLVFQDYALFPHLSVARNVEFGLKGRSTLEKRSRMTAVLEMVGASLTPVRVTVTVIVSEVVPSETVIVKASSAVSPASRPEVSESVLSIV